MLPESHQLLLREGYSIPPDLGVVKNQGFKNQFIRVLYYTFRRLAKASATLHATGQMDSAVGLLTIVVCYHHDSIVSAYA